MTTKFFFHREDSGFASREDLAAFVNGVCVSVWTIGVQNGNTTGSLNRPFTKGQTEAQMWAEVDALNTAPEDAACLCGATESWHTVSAACYDYSKVTEVTEEEALACAKRAKRQVVALSILLFLRGERGVKGTMRRPTTVGRRGPRGRAAHS